jgi:hypothetical protein
MRRKCRIIGKGQITFTIHHCRPDPFSISLTFCFLLAYTHTHHILRFLPISLSRRLSQHIFVLSPLVSSLLLAAATAAAVCFYILFFFQCLRNFNMIMKGFGCHVSVKKVKFVSDLFSTRSLRLTCVRRFPFIFMNTFSRSNSSTSISFLSAECLLAAPCESIRSPTPIAYGIEIRNSISTASHAEPWGECERVYIEVNAQKFFFFSLSLSYNINLTLMRMNNERLRVETDKCECAC